MQPIYWPYDEVSLAAGAEPDELIVDTPWLHASIGVPPEILARVKKVAQKVADKTLGAQDIGEAHWFFSGLSHLPLCYILPRMEFQGEYDHHTWTYQELNEVDLPQFLELSLGHKNQIHELLKNSEFPRAWEWDLEKSILFATNPRGEIDARTLFSVARKFHLLSSLETNKTADIYQRVKDLEQNQKAFTFACALMVRQNHYVTELCEQALIPALETAQTARSAVEHFIAEEQGHDRILQLALKTIVSEPEAIPVFPSTVLLMEMLKFCAQTNLLGFAMAVDIFERSAYQHTDPLADVLASGGLEEAAKKINQHMDINDAGEHENVALSFIEKMGPIAPGYAYQAMRLAEAVTVLISFMPTEVAQKIFAEEFSTNI